MKKDQNLAFLTLTWNSVRQEPTQRGLCQNTDWQKWSRQPVGHTGSPSGRKSSSQPGGDVSGQQERQTSDTLVTLTQAVNQTDRRKDRWTDAQKNRELFDYGWAAWDPQWQSQEQLWRVLKEKKSFDFLTFSYYHIRYHPVTTESHFNLIWATFTYMLTAFYANYLIWKNDLLLCSQRDNMKGADLFCWIFTTCFHKQMASLRWYGTVHFSGASLWRFSFGAVLDCESLHPLFWLWSYMLSAKTKLSLTCLYHPLMTLKCQRCLRWL